MEEDPMKELAQLRKEKAFDLWLLKTMAHNWKSKEESMAEQLEHNQAEIDHLRKDVQAKRGELGEKGRRINELTQRVTALEDEASSNLEERGKLLKELAEAKEQTAQLRQLNANKPEVQTQTLQQRRVETERENRRIELARYIRKRKLGTQTLPEVITLSPPGKAGGPGSSKETATGSRSSSQETAVVVVPEIPEVGRSSDAATAAPATCLPPIEPVGVPEPVVAAVGVYRFLEALAASDEEGSDPERQAGTISQVDETPNGLERDTLTLPPENNKRIPEIIDICDSDSSDSDVGPEAVAEADKAQKQSKTESRPERQAGAVTHLAPILPEVVSEAERVQNQSTNLSTITPVRAPAFVIPAVPPAKKLFQPVVARKATVSPKKKGKGKRKTKSTVFPGPGSSRPGSSASRRKPVAQLTCRKCKRTFLDPTDLKVHRLALALHDHCPLPSEEVATNSRLRSRITRAKAKRMTHAIVPEVPLHCCCGRSFQDEGALQEHVDYWNGKFSVKCSRCGKTCMDQASLNFHIGKYHPISEQEADTDDLHGFSHSQETPEPLSENGPAEGGNNGVTIGYVCKCKKLFASKEQLEAHARFIRRVRCFKCDICKERFAWEPDLEEHIGANHADKDKMEEN